jgi:hypothetical protein
MRTVDDSVLKGAEVRIGELVVHCRLFHSAFEAIYVQVVGRAVVPGLVAVVGRQLAAKVGPLGTPWEVERAGCSFDPLGGGAGISDAVVWLLVWWTPGGGNQSWSSRMSPSSTV